MRWRPATHEVVLDDGKLYGIRLATHNGQFVMHSIHVDARYRLRVVPASEATDQQCVLVLERQEY